MDLGEHEVALAVDGGFVARRVLVHAAAVGVGAVGAVDGLGALALVEGHVQRPIASRIGGTRRRKERRGRKMR